MTQKTFRSTLVFVAGIVSHRSVILTNILNDLLEDGQVVVGVLSGGIIVVR